jgi:transposase
MKKVNENKSLFTMLTESYPCKNIPPYGMVTVVPLKAFKEEWRSQLDKEGIRLYSTSYAGMTCFLLRKPSSPNSQSPDLADDKLNSVSEGTAPTAIDQHKANTTKQQENDLSVEKQNTAQTKESKHVDKDKHPKPKQPWEIRVDDMASKAPWTPQDREALSKLHDQGLSCKEISQRLRRSVQSVGAEISHLPSHQQHRKKPNSKATPDPEPSTIAKAQIADTDKEIQELIQSSLTLLHEHKGVATLLLKQAVQKLESPSL